MSSHRTHVTDNAAQLARLRALVARASDADLARPMPGGWTIASVLGHVAFWDQRALILIERWRRDAADAPGPIGAGDVDWINDAGKPLALAIAPRRAAELAVACADAVDRAVAALPDDFVARNAAAGHPISLDRAAHRREHLDEIEQVLATGRG